MSGTGLNENQQPSGQAEPQAGKTAAESVEEQQIFGRLVDAEIVDEDLIDEESLDDESLSNFDHGLFRKVLYFEWVLIALCALGEVVALKFAPPDPAAPNLIISLIFLGIVFLLSFVVPVKSSYWDRLCFLFLETVVLTGCAAAGIARFVFPLYMVIIAKACLILDARGRIVVFAAALLAQLSYGSYKIIISNPQLEAAPWTLTKFIAVFGGALIMTYSAIALMVLIWVLTLSLVAEQRLRLQAQRLAGEVESLALELERTRIAREIHDSLGHTLTSLNIQLEVARKFIDRDIKRTRESVELAKELASQSLKDVRMAVHSIRNSDFDFKEQVGALVAQTKQTHPLDFELIIEVPQVGSSMGYQLYRIIQECLTNVMKHAQATKVTITVRQFGNEIELSVADNGVGMTADAKNTGFGLRGMQERVESMRGKVEITSQPEAGTKIMITVPK